MVKLSKAVLAGCRIGKGDLGQLPWALGQSRSFVESVDACGMYPEWDLHRDLEF